MYWLFDGGWPLLVARLLWGLSFAALTLTTLAYAVADRHRAGTRVGLSRAIQQLGPVFALTAGAWVAGQLGPKSAFLLLGLASFLALPFALALPREGAEPRESRPGWLPKPGGLDWLFFAVGFTVDGVFVMTITIILADLVSLEAAILGGGIVLSLRGVGEAVFAPIAGWLGDRLGIEASLFAATALTLAGLAAIALGARLFRRGSGHRRASGASRRSARRRWRFEVRVSTLCTGWRRCRPGATSAPRSARCCPASS